jgi:hypothetical protein
MSHLIPEKRADRNGRMVTRHVLPPGSEKTPSRPIPAVQPLRSRTDQVLDFQKLTFLYKDGSTEDVQKVYPVASTVARALSVSSDHAIGAIFRFFLYDNEPGWVTDFATTCHFVAEAGGIKDGEAAYIAVRHAAMFHAVDDLMSADEEIQRETTELVSVLNQSPFLEGVVGHGGSSGVNVKLDNLLDYLCIQISDNSLQEKMPAILDIGTFLDFLDDEQESEDVVDNLDYLELIDLMVYTREHTNLAPDTVLGMVRTQSFKVSEVRGMIDDYDGPAPLIHGAL